MKRVNPFSLLISIWKAESRCSIDNSIMRVMLKTIGRGAARPVRYLAADDGA